MKDIKSQVVVCDLYAQLSVTEDRFVIVCGGRNNEWFGRDGFGDGAGGVSRTIVVKRIIDEVDDDDDVIGNDAVWCELCAG